MSAFLKGDDDILVNIFRAKELVKTLDQEEPKIWGCRAAGQVCIKKEGHRYADFIWPKLNYPPYVSGGGFIMNSKEWFLLLQKQFLFIV